MRLDDRAAAAKVSADQATLASALATLKKAQATSATSGDTNIQNVALAQQNLLAAQATLQSDVSAKKTGQISASGFSSLGMSGEAQLAQQQQLLVETQTNEQTAKEQYDGDKQLLAMQALSQAQYDRDKAAYLQAVASQLSAQRQYDLTAQQVRDSAGQMDSKVESDREAVSGAEAALRTAQTQASQNAAALDERSAEAGVQSADAALAFDQEQLDDTHVRAPFDGIIQTLGTQTSPLGGTEALAVGDQVITGQTLFTIASAGPMQVKAQVDEQDIINVKIGQHAFVTGEDFPGYTLIGTVIRVAPVVVAQTQAGNAAKNVETTIALTKVYAFLRDGMSCDVDIVTGKAEHALTVPQSAVVDDSGKHYVYVVKSGKAVKTQVTEGLKNDTDVVITKGVSKGDVIASTNVSDLKDGSPVKATPAESPTPSST
jgi:HlyD family secretion protein